MMMMTTTIITIMIEIIVVVAEFLILEHAEFADAKGECAEVYVCNSHMTFSFGTFLFEKVKNSFNMK